jgi:hypothetical protein
MKTVLEYLESVVALYANTVCKHGVQQGRYCAGQKAQNDGGTIWASHITRIFGRMHQGVSFTGRCPCLQPPLLTGTTATLETDRRQGQKFFYR